MIERVLVWWFRLRRVWNDALWRKVEPLTFDAGCAIDRDTYCVLVHSRGRGKISTSSLHLYQSRCGGEWSFHEMSVRNPISVSSDHESAGKGRFLYALGIDGDIEQFDQNGNSKGCSEFSFKGQYDGCFLRILCVGSALYVCSDDRGVFRRGSRVWETIGVPPTEMHANEGLAQAGLTECTYDIAVAADGALIVVGSEGWVARCVEGRWREDVRLTDEGCFRVCIEPEGRVWVVGGRGTLLSGTVEGELSLVSRKAVDSGPFEDSFCAVDVLDGVPYVGGDEGLFKLVGGALEEVVVDGNPFKESVVEIQRVDDVLWVLSTRTLLRMSSGGWEVFDHPENGRG